MIREISGVLRVGLSLPFKGIKVGDGTVGDTPPNPDLMSLRLTNSNIKGKSALKVLQCMG